MNVFQVRVMYQLNERHVTALDSQVYDQTQLYAKLTFLKSF